MREARAAARWTLLAPSLAVTLGALILPMLLMAIYSGVRYVPGRITDWTPTVENYQRLAADFFYLRVLGETVQLGLIVSILTAALGYPVALVLARSRSRLRPLLTWLVFLPMMVGIVVRAYGWMVILGREGLVNSALLATGLIDAPLRLLYTRTAVVLGLVEVMLPFMVMPLLATLEKIDPRIEEAARACGATRSEAFRKVTLPLSLPGLVSGSLLVFSLSITAYALPALLGGARVKMIAALAYDAMLVGYNWPFGAAIGIAMAAVSTTIVFFALRVATRWSVR